MKNYTVSEDFILAAHKEACCAWKSKLEKEFPDVFKAKFNDGDWVYIESGGCGAMGANGELGRFRLNKPNRIDYSGLLEEDYDGIWVESFSRWFRVYPEGVRVATKEECYRILRDTYKMPI